MNQPLSGAGGQAGVRAVIMAGGSGTRLRPLTDTLPKPLVPVAGKPVIFRILELLSRHGIKEAALTTGYLADKLEQACGEQYAGVRLTYFREDKPLGTAGGVKNTEPFLVDGADEFIVISGDAACETDLIAALNFHRIKNADATIVTVSVPSPLEYGVISSTDDGRITGFVEKPSLSQAYSDAANTGIYVLSRRVLELIPPDTPRDFGREVFPAMLTSGMKLFNFADNNYWCDIGDLDAYYNCCMRYAELEGKLSRDGNIVGSNCSLGGSTVRRSILFDGVSVSSGAYIDGAIICGSVSVGRGAKIAQGCVIGEGCVIGDRASLGPQVHLSAGKKIGAGQHITDGQPVFSSGGAELLSEGGIEIARSACESGLFLRLGAAAAAAAASSAQAAPASGRPIGIMRSANGASLGRFASLLAIGATEQGSDVYDFGTGFRALASFASERYAIPLTLFLEERPESVFISVFDSTGLCPPRTAERAFISALAGQTRKPEQPDSQARLIPVSGVHELYRASLAGLLEPTKAKRPFEGLEVRLCCTADGTNEAREGDDAIDLLAGVLRSAGATVACSGEEHEAASEFLRLTISPDGMSISAVERTQIYTCELDPWHIMSLILFAELDDKLSGNYDSKSRTTPKVVALPCSAPRILDNLAASQGVMTLHYSSQPSDDSEHEARVVAGRQRYQFDALFAAVKLCAIAARTGLKVVSDKIPHFYLASGDFDTDFAYKTLVMRRFGIPAGDGVCMEYNSSGAATDRAQSGAAPSSSPARVRMIPKRHGGFRIIAEADTMEAAEEMLALSKKRISEIISEAQTK
jgi:mannose-1-phosphate guanylyltransferase/phosphomannomutase